MYPARELNLVKQILLFTGIPATGKTEFCKYLSRVRGFAYYDLENAFDPRSVPPPNWPVSALYFLWFSRPPSVFVNGLMRYHDLVALDWGFHPNDLQQVLALRSSGVRWIWLAGEIARARQLYEERARTRVSKPSELAQHLQLFDNQIDRINHANLPGNYGALVVNALKNDGAVRALHCPDELHDEIMVNQFP
jgi:hypothetical protein